MYSVLRIMAEEPQRAMLETLVARANAKHPSTFDAPHNRRGGPVRSSCSIAEAPAFAEHVAALKSQLSKFTEEFAEAKAAGLQLIFDVALDSTDLRGRSLHEVTVDVELMHWFSSAGIGFELTIYSDDADDDDDVSDDDEPTTDPVVAVS